MPIAQLGFEGRYPVFTWATKPAANAVPVGKTITIPEFSYSDWYSDGTYWRPKGGQATLLVQDLTAFSYASTTLGILAGHTAPVLPWPELMAVPGFEIDGYLEVYRNTPANTQAYIVSLRYGAGQNDLFSYYSATESTGKEEVISAGTTIYNGAGSIRRAINSAYKATARGPANITPPATGTSPSVYLQTGGAGETMYPKMLQVVYRA